MTAAATGGCSGGGHGDRIGAFDHMVIGRDIPVRADHESRSDSHADKCPSGVFVFCHDDHGGESFFSYRGIGILQTADRIILRRQWTRSKQHPVG